MMSFIQDYLRIKIVEVDDDNKAAAIPGWQPFDPHGWDLDEKDILHVKGTFNYAVPVTVSRDGERGVLNLPLPTDSWPPCRGSRGLQRGLPEPLLRAASPRGSGPHGTCGAREVP